MKEVIVPHKTEREMLLKNIYIGWLAHEGKIPAQVVKNFKKSVNEIKKNE